MTIPGDWYADAALAKQAAIAALPEGERAPTALLAGCMEPRIAPTVAESCRGCGTDARPEVDGNGEFCVVCIGRGRADE